MCGMLPFQVCSPIMSIETRCGGCGRLLRVADEFAGRQARCPQCGFIYTVPPASGPAAADFSTPQNVVQTPAAASGPWWMKTPEGQTYGPVPRDRLDDWVREGRVTDDCQLRQGDQGAWVAAAVIYPSLAAGRARATPSSPAAHAAYGQSYGPVQQHGHAATASTYVSPYASPHAGAGAANYGYKEPHRGGVILTLGILGWFIGCPILSAIAWGLGSSDISKMRSGQMDAEGLGMTQAGQIMGMIQCILWLLGAGLMFLLVMCGAMSK
jgi:hypothetical protein